MLNQAVALIHARRRLAEADPVSGALRFELPEAPRGAPRTVRDGRRGERPQGRRGRPANVRHQGKRRGR